jgi:hypothetical protein
VGQRHAPRGVAISSYPRPVFACEAAQVVPGSSDLTLCPRRQYLMLGVLFGWQALTAGLRSCPALQCPARALQALEDMALLEPVVDSSWRSFMVAGGHALRYILALQLASVPRPSSAAWQR